MGRLTLQEVFWKEKLANPTSTDAEKAKAAEELEKIKRRHARKQTARHKKSSSQTNDPKPEWFPYDGGSYPEYLEKLSAWEKRHPEGYQEPVRPTPIPAPKKIELPKPAPVIVAPIAAPAPRPVPRICPPVIRDARQGYSGYFYNEVFWHLSPDERRGKMMRVNADLGLKAEWESICEVMAMRVTRREAVAPPKAVVIERPAIRERSEVFAVGQVQPVSEARKLSEPTMQNASGPVTRELDKRGWLPDIKPAELTPSR
jgi:hypothetical protein